MKKFFALYVVAVLAVALGTTTSKAGTIAHWMFEEGTPGSTASGVGTIIDSSANALHGTALGGPTYQDGLKSGTGNTGLRFDGINDTVRVASGSAGPLAMTGDFTIELGINARAQPNGVGFGIFYGDSQPSKDPYVVLVDNAGRLIFQIDGGATGLGTLFSAAGAITLERTTHVAAVFDYDDANAGANNMMRLYVDRMLVASLNAGNTTPFYGDTTSDLWIGSGEGQFAHFDGDLTDVRFSDTALTESEMLLVPEPGMLAIFGIGLMALGLTRRKRA